MAKKTKAAGLSIEEKLEQALVVPGYEPYQIPDNWCWTNIQFVCKLDNGAKHAKESLTYFDAKTLRSSIEPAFRDSGVIVEKGNKVILVDGENSGEVFVIPYRGYMGSTFRILNISNHIDEMYIRFFIDFNRDHLRNNKIGSAIPHLNKELFYGLKLPLPPLSEQQRIVRHIESLFSKLDDAKEKAQAVIDSFEIRKAAILHKAFSGELTAKWREENGVGIDSWEKCSLIDILIEKPRNGYSPKPVDYPTNVKSMTLSATTSGVFMPQYFKYIDEQISADSYLWLKKGDILIQRANSLDKVGTSAIYTGEDNEFIYPDLIMKLRVINKVSSHFIAYQLKTQKSIQYFRSNATGTAGNMPKINQKVVSATPIMLPTHAEQIELVRILDDLFSKETEEERNAKKVTDQIEKMKKAILSRAFRGELGTNDPSEESAVKLLKQILSGNTTDESSPKPKRKRVFIPKAQNALLKTPLERDIMKLFYQSESNEATMDEIMTVSSKKFDILDAIRALEKKQLIQKMGNNRYILVR